MTTDYCELSEAEAESLLEIILAQIDVLLDDMRRAPSDSQGANS